MDTRAVKNAGIVKREFGILHMHTHSMEQPCPLVNWEWPGYEANPGNIVINVHTIIVIYKYMY